MIDENDRLFQRLEHYRLHEEHLRIFLVNDISSNGLSSVTQNAENETSFSQPLTQTYPTGTTLISVDGFPIFKRKRGRPPKIKQEVREFFFFFASPRFLLFV